MCTIAITYNLLIISLVGMRSAAATVFLPFTVCTLSVTVRLGDAHTHTHSHAATHTLVNPKIPDSKMASH